MDKHAISRSGWLKRIGLALAGGFASSLAMPREGIWPLSFVAVAALLISVKSLRFWPSLTIGFIGGLSFYLSQVEWLSLYLGPVPWLALSILEAAIFAVGMAGTAVVWAWVEARISADRYPVVATISTALALASVFTAREWVSINLPYGGFPWSRLAQMHSESPLATWASVFGVFGLTFIVALISSLVALFLLSAIQNLRAPKALIERTVSALVIAVLFAIPAWRLHPSAQAESGSLTVAAVQGNANAGLFANPVRGSILKNHLDATELIKKDPLAKKVELVVWPENASDLSPFMSVEAQTKIRNLVDNELKVPLVFGAITVRGDQIFNSSIFWKPKTGPTDWYDKKRPVPFAEYVPDRDFWYQLAPDLIGLISHGYTFGERDGIFNLGNTKLGTLICFEIAIDDIGKDLVDGGAQVILSQTNNADFGHSDETYQQGALARLRAIETGRTVVNTSTVGVTAIYLPDGSIAKQIPAFEPGVIVETVPLRTSKTPAMLIAKPLDLANNITALILIALSFGARYKARRNENASHREA
jgi:apolipoprotein N-acyltransferase